MGSALPDLHKINLYDFGGLASALRLFYNLAVKEVDGAVGVFGKTSIVSHHAYSGAFTV
jgi:hypothetical protein